MRINVKAWRLSDYVLPVVVFSFYVGVFLPAGTFDAIQWHASDTLTRAWVQVRRKQEPALPVILVAVDDESLRRVNQRWPWDRRLLATVLDQLQAARPRLICVDLVLAGESTAEGDQQLAATLRQAGNVVLASYVGEQGELVKPLKIFQQAARAVGPVNKLRDSDLRIRLARVAQLSPTLDVEDFSIEVKAAAELLQATPTFQGEWLRFVDRQGSTVRSVQLRVDGVMPIDYRLRETDLTVVPIHHLLQSGLPQEIFRDHVVFLGATARMFHERYPTPLGSQPGVMILVNTLATLLYGYVPQEVPISVQWLLMVCGGFLATFGVSRLSPLKSFLLSAGVLAVFGCASALLSWWALTWDFVGLPLMVLTVYLIGTVHRSALVGLEAARLRLQATTDSLTGVANLGYLQTRLQHELIRVRRYGVPLAIVMFDIDDFKSINDRYGHACGNDLLKGLVDGVRRETRLADLVARYGGDEFCVVLFHTDTDGALAYAEHIRSLVLGRALPTRVGPLRVTISLGIAAVPLAADLTAERLMEQADMALYRSKQLGKNTVSVYEPVPSAT